MNGLFLLLAMSLCSVALGFVVFPLLRAPRGEHSESRRAINLAVHRDRVSDLDQDLAAGTLTQVQYDAALTDLERELLDSGAVDADERPSDENHGPRRVPLVAAGISVALLPFMAIGLYLAVGHAEEVFATQAPAGASVEAEPPSEADLQREFQHLARQLQGRLAQDPADLESWVLLGRTLVFLNDLEAAERAFREAMVHGGERDPDLLTRYADLLAERQGSLSGEPQRLIERALAIDPDHVQGLWLAGSRAYVEGANEEARHYWERLFSVLPEGTPEAEVIRGNLMQLSRDDESRVTRADQGGNP
ncbi:c-type cytochrome biogenesis protein CcmI [Billgrantia tianxiuensis]|jgi:cytochrome c-type biogenesis protein CcmH|uniref:C-type cytochrome biogenesis protein CcmI n=1 Tax=Billgrantia tianxiuensis TaxID=2497861 RepID=A0A6I6SP21_9GAMM|nr:MULTISPECIES: c-type cytochrome biogenesis protein CcmI [Halomonas]MCE8035077.1 c-type cytochrome biogenesis protein CcmI [Halomonas sp. MCCC 1A11057]QHC48423.1 c-type cytochrome biogenesis protein CcmI [Halomonas tianxiuensis]